MRRDSAPARLASTTTVSYDSAPRFRATGDNNRRYLDLQVIVIDFDVQKFTRRCAASDRELQPGDRFYSVLIPNGAEVERLDYAESAWQGAPEDAIGYWKSEVPDPRANRMQLAPNDVLLQYFESMYQSPHQSMLAYVLTLLMIRRRVFKLELSERDEHGREVMLVYCTRNEKEYRIPVAEPGPSELGRIQQQLADLLFARAD